MNIEIFLAFFWGRGIFNTNKIHEDIYDFDYRGYDRGGVGVEYIEVEKSEWLEMIEFKWNIGI